MPTGLAPPSNPEPSLRPAAQHLTGCMSFASSPSGQRAAISHFSRETWQRDLARAENREFAGVLERGAGLKTKRASDIRLAYRDFVRLAAMGTVHVQHCLPGCAQTLHIGLDASRRLLIGFGADEKKRGHDGAPWSLRRERYRSLSHRRRPVIVLTYTRAARRQSSTRLTL